MSGEVFLQKANDRICPGIAICIYICIYLYGHRAGPLWVLITVWEDKAMKNLERVMTFLMAVMIALYGLPLTGASAQENGLADAAIENVEEEINGGQLINPLAAGGPAMKFIQTDFRDGVLTMSLFVKTSDVDGPDKPLDSERPGPGETLADGTESSAWKNVGTGFLAFQVDARSMVPITWDGKEIYRYGSEMAFVGNPKGTVSNFTRKKEIYDDESNKGFERTMTGPVDPVTHPVLRFNSNQSFFAVSALRENTSEKALDCYLQYQLTQRDRNEVDADGYVKVIDLRFKCTLGGSQATEDALFAKSVRLPKTKEEAETIVKQFYSEAGNSESASIAVGAAGFTERGYIWQNSPPAPAADYWQGVTASYYYYDQPTATTPWYTPYKIEKGGPLGDGQAPEFSYSNMEKKYIVQSFYANNSNTYGEKNDPSNPDFIRPSGTVGDFPRYWIPTAEEQTALEGTTAELGSWVPYRYTGAGANAENPPKQTMIKYMLWSLVSSNSDLRPEYDFDPEAGETQADALDKFFRNIEWHFAFADRTLLDDYSYSLTGESYEVAQENGNTYTVERAVINDVSSKYNGKAVQVVTNKADPNDVRVTPVGIMFDYNEKTPITYRDMNENLISGEGYAPQLRITKDAADTESYLWDENNKTENRCLYIFAIYKDSSGGSFQSALPMEAQVYKSDFVASQVSVTEEREMKVTDPEGNEVDGFRIPVGGDVKNDELANEGIPYRFKVDNQYDFTMLNKEDNPLAPTSVTMEPDEETKSKLKDPTKSPFMVRKASDTPNEDGSYSYTLEYTPGADVNTVAEGYYILKASYGSVKLKASDGSVKSWSKTYYVTKDPNKFSYMKIGVSVSNGDSLNVGEPVGDQESGVREVQVTIPEPEFIDDGKGSETKNPVSRNISFQFQEMANQWRDLSNGGQEPDEYDVVPGLRESGALSLSKIRANFDLTHTWEVEDPTKDPTNVLTDNLAQGYFTFTSDLKDGAVLNLTIEATPKTGEKITRTNRFKFVFSRKRRALKNIRIVTSPLTLQVPTEEEYRENGKRELQISALAYDQYGDLYDWNQLRNDVYPGHESEPAWTLKVKGTLPAGVSQNAGASRYNNVIAVDNTVDACNLTVWAEFITGTKSAEAVLRIQKPPRVPTVIRESITFDIEDKTTLSTTLYVPDNSDPTATVSATPKIIVRDQYGEVMEENAETGYTVRWSFVDKDQKAVSYDRVSVDRSTGKVTVKSCAPEVKDPIWLKATIQQAGADTKLYKIYDTLYVKRMPEDINRIDIDQDGQSLAYPLRSDSPAHSLTASSQTQYSENGKAEAVNAANLTWRLEKIVLQDGTEIVRANADPGNPELEIPTGDIELEGGVYKDKVADSLTFSTTGVLRLDTARSREKAPKQIQVRASYNGRLDIVDTATINISLGDPVPTMVEITSSAYLTNMEVPLEGQPPVTRTLNAYVNDQFGFRIQNPNLTWSIAKTDFGEGELAGSAVSINGNVLSITNNCPSGVVTIQAAYAYDDPEHPGEKITISDERDIGIQKDNSETPATIEITGLSKPGQVLSDASVPLPALGINAKLENPLVFSQDTVTVGWRIKDKYGKVISQPVSLYLVQDTYGVVKNADPTTKKIEGGRITFAATKAWIDAGGQDDPQIQVKAVVNNTSPAVETADYTITLKRQADIPSYAIPYRGDYKESDRDYPTYKECVLIPEPGEDTSYVEFTAEVYSQYGTLMADTKNGGSVSGATISFSTDARPGLRKVQDPAAGKARWEVTSLMTIPLSATFTATVVPDGSTPENAAKTLLNGTKTSTVVSNFMRGVAFADSIQLGEGYNGESKLNNNPDEVNLEAWNVLPGLNVPPADANDNTQTVTFAARVTDQYEAAWTVNDLYYPVWELAEEYEGVTLIKDDPATLDSFGNLKGKKVTDAYGNEYYQVSIEVDRSAVGQGKLEKTIDLICRIGTSKSEGVNGILPADTADKEAKYKAVQRLSLKKSPSQPRHIFFGTLDQDGNLVSNVDEDGIWQETWERPTLAEGSVTKKVSAVILDQYGYGMRNAVSYAPETSSVESQGGVIEPVYGEDVDSEEPGSAKPVKYRILQNNKLAVEINAVTGEVTVYTACTLENLIVKASSPSLSNQEKLTTINFKQFTEAELDPTLLTFQRENQGALLIKSVEDEAFTESVLAVVQDQFGDVYNGNKAFPVWEIQMKDKDGNYVPYQEFDDEGNPLPADEWLVSASFAPGEKNVILTVRPENYKKPITVRLYCDLLSGDGQPSLGITGSTDIEIRQYLNTSSGGGQSEYTVSYFAGDHGMLVGAQSEVVPSEGSPKSVPVIKPEAGYGVVGWRTRAGEIIEDPHQMVIMEDTDLTVVYNDITKYKFLSGYDDSTVRPNKNVTRAEFVTMLVRAINNYDPDLDYSHPFTDIDSNRFYSGYVAYAFTRGIVSGYGDNTFQPNATITRAEASRMIAEAANLALPQSEETKSFSDVDPERWYAKYITLLASNGLISGYGDGTFRPENFLTRAEAVRLLVPIMQEAPSDTELKRISKNDFCPFKDVDKSKWYYAYILRAAGIA